MCRPFGPTTVSTSPSISRCSTPSPTPTESASSPSFAAPASSPSASSTDSGSPSTPSGLAATDAADTVLMRLVLLSSWTWFRTHHGPNGTGRGGRTAASSSTSYGTSSIRGLDEKIVALYGGGMTTRDIETYIGELYGPGVGRDT